MRIPNPARAVWRYMRGDDIGEANTRAIAAHAAQMAEADRQVQAAARREAADEEIRRTSRRVMREMWPPKPAGSDEER